MTTRYSYADALAAPGAAGAPTRTFLALRLGRAIAALWTRADRLRAEDELHRLPARMLADLGLRRSDLEAPAPGRAGATRR